MRPLVRYSEAYSAIGGLAAEGVVNQLGRPDIEPLEILVREAVQNCWDAKRPTAPRIKVEIGRHRLDAAAVARLRTDVLVNPPPGLPLAQELTDGMEMLYFADFGTSGLGGPTRADESARGQVRDFVDFVRNIGQPPDKALGGGSFGYGKAAFYRASRARTIIIDTLCGTPDGGFSRRFLGCALGEGYESGGHPFTGRHWWGRVEDDVPEPLLDDEAAASSEMLNLPTRDGESGLGTTVVIMAPGVAPEAPEGIDATFDFLAEAIAWNFWPRMISTPGGARSTMSFDLIDQGTPVRVPDPRRHDRLRGFVDAMDRLRVEPEDGDETLIDRPIDCLRPIRRLGRLVIQKGPVAPLTLPDRAVPKGARQTADSVHHIALMRNAELVVKYLPGPDPVTGRFGYSGVFRCGLDIDETFRRAEPPAHDDWVYRAVPDAHERRFVKVAIDRITRVCREAAGYEGVSAALGEGSQLPLGEFADALARLMPGLDGPGARRETSDRVTRQRRRKHAPGRGAVADDHADAWVDGVPTEEVRRDFPVASYDQSRPPTADVVAPRPQRLPQTRPGGDPKPAIASDGEPVIQYPFELRGYGSTIRLTARVEVMTNDGVQVETEPPRGYEPPAVRGWLDPSGSEHRSSELVAGPDGVDGSWIVEVPLRDETMMRVDVLAEIA